MTSMIRSSSAVTSHPENDATRQNGEWEQEKILFTDSFLHTQDTQDTDTDTHTHSSLLFTSNATEQPGLILGNSFLARIRKLH